jgi:hypothetical protein
VTNTDIYSYCQDALPGALNEPGLGVGFNGADNQVDPSSLNGLVKPDQGILQMSPPQSTVPSELFPFAEGHGIESFTFDEVYGNGLSIKDADVIGTDEESVWQVS